MHDGRKFKVKDLKGKATLALLFALGFTLFSFNARAAERAGAAFLKIDVGARAIGMGGAFTAVADDASAAYWNTAGLAALQRREAVAAHADWLAGLRHDYAAYAHPGAFGGTLGVNVVSLRAGEIEGRDSQRQAVGSFTAADTAVGVSFAKSLGMTMAGINVKLIEQRLASHRARGAAVDLGLLRPLPIQGLTLGLAAQNLGPRLAFDDSRSFALPFMLKTGLAYSPLRFLTMAGDLKYEPRNRLWQAAYGIEFTPLPLLALRAGYHLNPFGGALIGSAEEESNPLAGFQGGIGVAAGKSCRLDYAIVPLGDIGNVQRFSLSVKF